MNEELKPCAHCGGKVEWCECGMCGRVWCPTCKIMTEFSAPNECDTLDKERAFTSEQWNRRTPTVTNASAVAAPGASELPPLPAPVSRRVDAGLCYVNVSGYNSDQMREYAKLALAGQCGARQEPVAYRYKSWSPFHKDGEGKPIRCDRWNFAEHAHQIGSFSHSCGEVPEPLYATPASAQPKYSSISEQIVSEGGNLICTACGTTTPVSAQGAQQGERAAVPEVVQQALDIALDLAMAEADNVHKTYAGYKQHKHDAADRDVETIKRAIDAINPAAAQAQAQDGGEAS